MVMLMSTNCPQKLSRRPETMGNSQRDKGKTRVAIKTVGKEMVHKEERWTTKMIGDGKRGNNEADHGTGNCSTGFVFPFSYFLHAHAVIN